VFTLPKLVYDKFAEADLRDRAIFQFDPAQIVGLEFKGWKGNAGFVTDLNFAKGKDGVWAVTKSPGPYTVDPKKIDAFLTLVSNTTVKTFLNTGLAPDQGFGDDKIALGINIRAANGQLIALTLGAPTDGGSAYYAWTNLLPFATSVFTVEAGPFKMYKDNSGVFAK
jgi:hypothetical protein